MADSSIKRQALSGAAWKFAERISAQAVGFVVSILLARLLTPDDYGLIALVFVFTTICNKLVIAGFSTSLIQKKDADDIDFSSVLLFSLFAASILYLALFFAAPLIANFYTKFDRSELILVIRVLGINLFIVAFNSVQHAFVSKHMLFKRYFWSTLVGTLLSGIVGVVMAYMGCGVWSLVAQNLIMVSTDCIILWFTVKWRPTRRFSFIKLKNLFTYGWRIMIASLIKTVYNDICSLVIGKAYTPSDLAFYNRGQSIPQLVETQVAGTIDSVLFPVYSKMQTDMNAMLNAMRRAIKTSCYILMPALCLLAAVATPLVTVLLTDKWISCVPYLQILSFAFMFSPIELENLQAIKAIGRSDIVLNLEIVKKIVGILLLLVAIPFGLNTIAISMLISFVMAAVINAYPSKKLFGYSFFMQIVDIVPSIIMAIVIFIVVSCFIAFVPISNSFVLLLLSLLIGFLFYLGVSTLFQVDAFLYIVRSIHELIGGKPKRI